MVSVVVTVVVILVVTVFTVPEPLAAKIPPSGTVSGGEVEVVALAASLANAASVFPDVGALIAATIPLWQCASFVCAQYIHKGLVSLTTMVKTWSDVTLVGMKVEKNPPLRGWHGSAKLDWVTEWFWGGVC